MMSSEVAWIAGVCGGVFGGPNVSGPRTLFLGLMRDFYTRLFYS